ncbi:MAG: hypothetical protein IKT52_11840 [Oscillospiraceae bacterium]|nr:hypothetical protein [Oscillospiraceae bacterium]
MGTIVSQIIEKLRAGNIRADEAYPGGRIPALAGAVAAVRLGKIDRSVRTTTVQVVIMSPALQGGSLCETTALQAIEVLQKMDGTCRKDICKFDEMADVFYIEIEAEFFGTALPAKWSAGPGFSVTIGQQAMNHVVSFGIARKTDDEVTAIANAKWEFTLEELLPPGSSEPPDPTEPFSLMVTRSNCDEMLTGCTFISVKREDTLRGISQVRTGIAEKRSVMGIL